MAREATHAGLWYTAYAGDLGEELQTWLDACGVTASPRARAVIAPHAGYHFSGRCAAYAFAQIDPLTVNRIFLLGPSHHHPMERCALSPSSVYRTPLGDIPIDAQVYADLKASGEFDILSSQVDEAEHSMELHLPYLVKAMKGRPFTLVPIMVGALTPPSEARYGRLLAKFFADSRNFFSVSSDFCHWGTRFNYTPYDKEKGPIFKSIEAMDREGMRLIEARDPAAWTDYLARTGNSICGKHPISILLQVMRSSGLPLQVQFVQYEQSSQCKNFRDSSVSYVSGVVLLGGA